MSISLLAVEVRHERRIRCLFSAPLGAGAYTTPYYTVTSLDDLGASPAVVAVMMLTSSTTVAELVLSTPLVQGGLYSVSAIGVPAADASVTPAESVEQLRYGSFLPKENSEPIKRDRERLLYGVDLLWDGTDWLESATGDLDIVGGTPNVNKALRRRVDANGRPWDHTYGVYAREFVDSPSGASGTLRGKLNSQLLLDPRVKEVTTTVSFDTDDNTFLNAAAKLKSGEAILPVTLKVPSV